MCGPLVIGIPFRQSKGRDKLFSVSFYMLSKALGYAMLGLITGAVGFGLRFVLYQKYISIFTGILLIGSFLLPTITRKIKPAIAGSRFIEKNYLRFVRSDNSLKFVPLGFLNALLPCGLVYTALATAFVTGSMWQAAALMFAFGIGVAFLLSIFIFSKDLISPTFRIKLNTWVRWVTLLLGIILVMRGLGLGIPFLSPAIDASGRICD